MIDSRAGASGRLAGKERVGESMASQHQFPAGMAAAEWRGHWPLVVTSMLGWSLVGIGSVTTGAFIAPLQQAFGWTRAEATIGPLIYAIMSILLQPVVGRLIDRFTRVSKAAYATIPAASLVLAIPFYLGFLWAPDWRLALLLLLGPAFLNYFYLSSVVALVQEEVRPDQRVMAGALLLLVMNFIGLGLGPTYVGAASDYFHASHPEHSLQIALYTLTPFYVVAIVLFLWLARILRREQNGASA